MPISQDELAARVRTLRASYATKLPERLVDIASGVRPLIESEWTAAAAADAARLAHNLAGTGATFGFADLGAAARELEDLIVHLRDNSDGRPSGYRGDLVRHVRGVFDAASRAGVVGIQAPTFSAPV